MRATSLAVVALSCLLALLLAGCPPKTEEGATGPATSAKAAKGTPAKAGAAKPGEEASVIPKPLTKKELTIGIAMTWGHPYWQNMITGLKDEAKDWEKKTGKKITLIPCNAEEDASKQISQCESLVAQAVDGAVVVPVQEEASVRAVRILNDANIPVVLDNRQIKDRENKAKWVCYTGTDTFAGAKVSAELLCKALGNKGKIVELEQVIGSNPQVQRTAALHDVLRAHPDVKLIAQETFGAEEAKTVGIMENLLSAHPDIAGVYAHGDNAAIFALKACEAARRPDIKIVGMGGSIEALKLIKAGKLVGTSYQQPYEEGRMGMRFILQYLTGEKVKKYQPTEVIPLTKENAGQYKGQF